jgi:hypothetical protein
MAQISIDEASARTGVPRQTLEAWAERGLLTIQSQRIDEDELEQVVDSMGWLHLSEQGWEGAGEE